VSLRGAKGAVKLAGEDYTLGEQIQYTDIWANDNYLQFMYERLVLIAELLAPNGTLYLHCDARKNHYLRLLLDEVLGNEAFVSEIVWQSADAQSSANRYGPIHNTILYYARGPERVWNPIRTPLSKSTADSWYNNEEVLDRDVVNKRGVLLKKGEVRRYNKADLTARKPGGDTEYDWKGVRPPIGRYWAYSRENMEEFDKQGLLTYSESGRPYLKRYLDEVEGTPPQDLWTDISMIRGIGVADDWGYPTEKPETLLERIIRISSHPQHVILDCFIGSGTTGAVAQKLGRRWIGCDINKGAIQTTSRRLQGIIAEQIEEEKKPRQTALVPEEKAPPPSPAQLSFSVHRVNDYDLAIQHVEAVNLACEHLGVERTRTDAYFDGTLGRRIVKIVPFNHPLTPLDLDELQRELASRPDEDRDVVVVCLGKDPASDAWIEDWNRLRKGQEAVNRISLVELRTDPKYGKFFQHQPARARVKVERKGEAVIVTVQDFISPTIVERLHQQESLLEPKIEDWRWLVDSIQIDADHDGSVFRIALSDVPERKTDLVAGRYELSAAKCGERLAVKLTDMLGEEVVVALLVP
jgi:adenine-specific DNA-methyltransferase